MLEGWPEFVLMRSSGRSSGRKTRHLSRTAEETRMDAMERMFLTGTPVPLTPKKTVVYSRMRLNKSEWSGVFRGVRAPDTQEMSRLAQLSILALRAAISGRAGILCTEILHGGYA